MLVNTKSGTLAGNGTPTFAVFPPVVEFHGIEPDTLYCITLSVRNRRPVSQRVRIVPPRTNVFTAIFNPDKPLAPGLDVKIEVQFRTNKQGTYHDNLKVMTESGAVEVPLHAYAPTALVEFDNFVNLGIVVKNNSVTKLVPFKNVGLAPTNFTITWDETLPLRITPASGVLGPTPRTAEDGLVLESRSRLEEANPDYKAPAEMNIAVELSPQAEGAFRTVAKVEFPGQQPKLLDIHATVVEQRLSLTLAEGGALLSSIPFGVLFYGQTRTVHTMLVNNGPQVTSQ